MKKPITLVLALLTFASVAQYNSTYDVNGNADFLVPSFVITNPQGETTALSIANDAPGTPRTDYFIITKNDCKGKPIYNTRYYTGNFPIDGMTDVEALVETQNGDLLVAGYYYDQQQIHQPMLIKLDPMGNFMWKKVYYVNKRDIVDIGINKISLCLVYPDLPQENYLIVASGDSNIDPGNSVVTNVIKVDINGVPMGERKYYFPGGYQTSRDYPGDIEYSAVNKMFMITGYRNEVAADGTLQHSMFFFGINNILNVWTPGMKTLTSKSIPIDQDMIYDQSSNQFAVVFTHDQTGYAPGANSVIGFIKTDPFLNVNTPMCYWHKDGFEHNGRSISMCATGEYALGAGIYDPSLGLRNPGFLKITPLGVPTINFTRYNILDDVYFGHHTTTTDCSLGNEQYILVNEYKTDLRLIRPDVNGKVCGSRTYKPLFTKYAPKEITYDYFTDERMDWRDYDLVSNPLDIKPRECKAPGNSYRPSVATSIDQLNDEGNALALYPSVLSADNARLTLVNNSSEALKIELHNIAGQLIYSNSNIAAGTNEVQLNTKGSLAEGVYLVKVYDAKGALTTATKIIITK